MIKKYFLLTTGLIAAIFAILYLSGCREKNQEFTTVLFRISQAAGRKAILEQVPFSDETVKLIDSATIKSGSEELIFHIPKGEERIYRLKVTQSEIDISFVNDVPFIEITSEILKPDQYIIEHSPANASLKKFMAEQKNLSDKARTILEQSPKQGKMNNADSASFIQTTIYKRYIEYTDTVSSPGVFLLLYNQVDFGKDYPAHKQFIVRAGNRFPRHSRIQILKEKTLKYLRIFEEEWEVGQRIPEIALPDEKGIEFSTTSLRGKPYLINFWSSWCDICFLYNKEIKRAKDNLSSDFEIVSIAIDSEKDMWKDKIISQKLDWVQLIDEKMWQGKAVQTFKIDSIPFNFLVDEKGILIKKAMPLDSIYYFLSEYSK